MEANNNAKLREAVTTIRDMATPSAAFGDSALIDRIFVMAQRALAEPPRNCDRFNSGNAERDAEMAWNAITSGMNLQFSDLTDREIAIIKESMRGFVWLFTTADESVEVKK